jgi:S-DNA-T family DNA segregation ATPase FtsK/SpoIIIE
MKIFGPSSRTRLNEAIGVVCLVTGLVTILSLASYNSFDPSFNTANPARPQNLIGYPGSYFADFCYQVLGFGSFVAPALLFLLGVKWFRSQPFDAPWIRVIGSTVLLLGTCTALSLGPEWRPFGGVILAGGLAGMVLADFLVESLNLTGAILATATAIFLSLYLISSFSMAKLYGWFAVPIAWWRSVMAGWSQRWQDWQERRAQKREDRLQRKLEKAERRMAEAAAKAAAAAAANGPAIAAEPRMSRRARAAAAGAEGANGFAPAPAPVEASGPPIVPYEDRAPWEEPPLPFVDDIPIKALEDMLAPAMNAFPTLPPALPEPELAKRKKQPPRHPASFVMPSTSLLNEAAPRNPYDEQELKETAARIKSKFEEFNVLGNVVQINPGPVVTTFEFKPEAGIKYSRITTLSEDLCLGLQAESILIERIPGKPTVGIEVPNVRREVISLRQILESDEFQSSPSRMTISLGKDISGRIKVAPLETMPHLLIAGSTGSGKSVMLNTLIMSILYKSTPDEVRMIMVDPKRLEMGLYEGIPHLLTPVITDAKKATYALRNAVVEMERRLKLLAAQGVRNIDQYNKKVRLILSEPRSLFDEENSKPELEELRPLPYILILIDELADLMMLERANVEESVTRLAQMARAVGMHLVLATQRPSVDVITGLIKANFPARISFRVATRVDSRTILDVMGSEHLLGKGDMLFLPPGSSRLTRVHGAFVTESETNKVVDFWKAQAVPEYDQSFLTPPPSEDGDEDGEAEAFDGSEDAMYQDAVRCVLELGKASTSTLQRRLRLGYGRAARILDMMQREGIIGPPDGSRPREVLKRPDWLQEIDHSMR